MLPRFWKSGSDVAALAMVQMLCFLALAWLEPRFFIVHLYQLIPYLALLVLFGYGQTRWAYMIAPLVSIGWFGLAYLAGLLGSAVERVHVFRDNRLDANLVALLALVTAAVAVLMTVLSRMHWIREFSESELGLSTFSISLGIVVVYYAVLLQWFWI